MNQALRDRPATRLRAPVELCSSQIVTEFIGQHTVLAEVRLMLGELSRERIHYLPTFLQSSDSAVDQ